jgi:hypothetical protein
MAVTRIGWRLPRTSAWTTVPARRARRHVGHRDRLADARPTVPLVTRPICDAGVVDEVRAFAHRHALEADEADPLDRRAVGELPAIALGAGIAAGALAAGPAHLLDRPGEAGLDRRGGGVDVVAVEAQARLEPQRVARAEAGGRDLGLGEQGARERLGLGGGDRDLEAVFAGVAGARREAGDAVDRRLGAGHEGEPGELGREALHHRGGLRALQREQGPLGQGLDQAAGGQVRAQVRGVGLLAGGVDDEEQVVVAPRHHQVVEDAAGVVREERVALLARGEADDVDRHQRLERRRGVVAGRGGAGPCARRRTAPPTRGTAGARRGCPADTTPASSSRRTAPSSRRARGAARAAACAAAPRARRSSGRRRSWRLRSKLRTRAAEAARDHLPLLSALPERLAAPRTAPLAPSVDPLEADLSPARNADFRRRLPVLVPERSTRPGGPICAFGGSATEHSPGDGKFSSRPPRLG